MIGGFDIRIATEAGESALLAAYRAILQFWDHPVVENASTGGRYEGAFFDIPFDYLEEIFVYRDSNSADLWDEEGAVEGVQNTMIHLIAEPRLTTVVVDDPTDPEMSEVIAAIRSNLANDIFAVYAEAA